MLAFLRNGDTSAFGEIYTRYRLDVYRYLMTLVKIPDIAEDLTHEVFLKIWEVREKLEIRQSFRSYLFRVSHNKAFDANKKLATERHLVDQLTHHYQVFPTVEHYSQEELQRYDNLVEEALKSLTPQRRRVYELCKKEKKSYEEVAAELQISPNTVKTHISQTLALLRNFIQERGELSLLLILMVEAV